MATAILLYRRAFLNAAERDPLARILPGGFTLLGRAFGVDALYGRLVDTLTSVLTVLSALLDTVINLVIQGIDRLATVLGKISYLVDDGALNDGADQIVLGTQAGGTSARRLADGRIQDYVALAFAGMVLLAALFVFVTVR
jgi:NADH-quinone oxidoreductase subunit L